MSKRPKGILPDGKKIKDLRIKAGKTQKGLIQGSAIELRTYQRAEQGKAILPEILQQIGVLLSKDVSEIRLITAIEQPNDNTFRMFSLNRVGANQLVQDLRAGPALNFQFAINPGAEIAEQVAATVEYCELLAKCGSDADYLAPAGEIRAIGHLNDLVAHLSQAGVYSYAGKYYTYDDGKYDINDDQEYRVPIMKGNVRIVFAAAYYEYITQTYPSWRTEKAAAERCTEWNLKQDVAPEIIDGRDFFGDYALAYRAAHEAHAGQKEPLLLLRAAGAVGRG